VALRCAAPSPPTPVPALARARRLTLLCYTQALFTIELDHVLGDKAVQACPGSDARKG